MYETAEIKEKYILVAVDLDDGDDIEYNLHELKELVKTAGAEVVGTLVQNKEHKDKGTYIGSGKTLELKDMVEELGATGIVCDDELTPAQFSNLHDILDTKIIDRTTVILDIFAKRAVTSEGKIQVELAQLKYRAARLTGLGKSLSRLGGGIGTKGPGEKKLEIDRRIIRDRISQLQKEADEVAKHRDVMRKKRMSGKHPVVAIVGYTNAGKSTLLNKLTKADVYEMDQLFATLDPTSRNYKLPNGQEIILTDTVGFIKKLPHHLIKAFRSTLEEAKYADIILHIVDISNDHAEWHIQTVYETFDTLGIEGKPIITAFNKMDKLEDPDNPPIIKDLSADICLNMAIKPGINVDKLNEALEQSVNNLRTYIEKVIPYSDAGKINLIHKYGNVLKEEYQEDGIYIEAYVEKSLDI